MFFLIDFDAKSRAILSIQVKVVHCVHFGFVLNSQFYPPCRETHKMTDENCLEDAQTRPQDSKEVMYEFAVDFKYQETVQATKSVLQDPRISKVECDFTRQQCLISSSLPPSDLIQRIRSLGVPCVLRGISQITDTHGGKGMSKGFMSAAVCIFEHFPGMRRTGEWAQYDNRGVCRLIQTEDYSCLLDMTLNQMEPKTNYRLSVNEYGDISEGARSTGDSVFDIGEFKTDEEGKVTFIKDVESLKVHECIGRSLVVSIVSKQLEVTNEDDRICGIIARSAGLFENVKKVCSCSGNTLWEEISR